MSILTTISILILLIWVFIYTVSFGAWTWRKGNPLGAIMVYILACITLVLPLWTMFNGW